MRDNKIKVKLRGWRSDGLVLEPVNGSMRNIINAIKAGKEIIMVVEKNYERSEQDISNNGNRSRPVDYDSRHALRTALGIHKRPSSR